jgi:trans-aconitate methyltransferase
VSSGLKSDEVFDREFAAIQPHERVLDVGCGAGAPLARLRARLVRRRAVGARELRAGGFGAVEQTEHAVEFVFADEQAWWDWNWSHASRVFLEALPAEPRERYRAEVAEAMAQVRESNGFPRTFTSVFTRGFSG